MTKIFCPLIFSPGATGRNDRAKENSSVTGWPLASVPARKFQRKQRKLKIREPWHTVRLLGMLIGRKLKILALTEIAMLVLSRKPNQKINIGSDITITVVKVRGNVIRLGIEAPRDVRVVRSELELKIDESLTADIAVGDESSEATEGPSDEVGPRQSSVTIARYSVAS